MERGNHITVRYRPTIAHLTEQIYDSHTTALYRSIRISLGLTQKEMAAILGVSRENLCRRELGKRRYTLGEIVGLYQLSGLPPAKYLKLLATLADDTDVVAVDDEVTP